jgi:hypothetical protein
VATVSSGLASKPAATVFSSLASKLVVMVSPGLASKPVVDFLVEPQNQGGGGFSSLGLKTGRSGLVIWASKSPWRFLGLGLKTKWDSVCWLRHKTDRGRSVRRCTWHHRATMGGAHGTIVEVASEQVEDRWVNATGCVGPCYPTFAIFNVLGPRGIVVI